MSRSAPAVVVEAAPGVAMLALGVELVVVVVAIGWVSTVQPLMLSPTAKPAAASALLWVAWRLRPSVVVVIGALLTSV